MKEKASRPYEQEIEPYFVYRWEAEVAVQITLMMVTLSLIAPFVISLFRLPIRVPIPTLGPDPAAHRQLTGFVGLGLVVLQLLMGLRRRMARRPLSRFVGRWRTVHGLVGMLPLFAVLIHTGGATGANLNRALVFTLITLVGLAQAGHLMKAIVWTRAMGKDTPEAFARMQLQANTDEGIVHVIGAQVHTLLAAILAILLLFHVLAAYFF